MPPLLLALASVTAPQCLVIEGPEVVASELAAAVPAFAAAPPGLALAPAPVPGLARAVRAPELQRWAQRAGLVLETPAPLCLERRRTLLERDAITAALDAALATLGVEARIELHDFSRGPFPPGRLSFSGSTLASAPRDAAGVSLWRGRLEYAPGHSLPAWARVKLVLQRQVLVVTRALAAGQKIGDADCRLETRSSARLENTASLAPEEAIGRILRRSLPAGAEIKPAMLALAPLVERGDEVEVESLSGAARLVFRARAETAGTLGQNVIVVNPANQRRFRARVESAGRVRVDSPATSALEPVQ